MATQGPSHCLEPKHFMTLGLNKAVVKKTENILLQVLLWGTPNRKSDESFYDYLLNTKGISKTRLKKIFNRGQRDKLKTDHQMKSFDVSLLYLCIMYGCDRLAPPNDSRWDASMNTLEGLIATAKKHRNSFVHGDYEISEGVFDDKIKEIEDLLIRIMVRAAHHFGIDQVIFQPLLKEFKKELRKIKYMPFQNSPSSYLSTLFKIEGRKDLKNIYMTNSTLSPASNLIGKDIWVEIGTVFTQMEIYTSETQKQLLPVDEIFEHVESSSSTKKKILLLVEGVAGSGKTTLTRKILHEWSKGSTKMKNLDNYDLAIWTECRDSKTRSLAQLLRLLMPTVTQSIKDDKEVVTSIQKNELLFIVDGLDELNKSSEQVLNDILDLENTDIITIVCTTRTNKVHGIKRRVKDKGTFQIKHVNIKGIAEQNRESFVMNYYRALQNRVAVMDPNVLLRYLKESHLHDHWRLPFNLVLLTVLWMWKPNVINEMTTATELFLNTFELCKDRLIHRLQANEETRGQDPNEIQKKLDPFVKGIAKVAFDGHYNNEAELSGKYINSLKQACYLKNLPPEEVMSSFLVQVVSLINKSRDKFKFPHKGMQDFFSARYIEAALKNEDTPVDVSGILSSIDPILDDKFPPAKKMRLMAKFKDNLCRVSREDPGTYTSVRRVFENAIKACPESKTGQIKIESKWRNILVHLTGLLCHGGLLTQERAKEMVTLLKENGIENSTEWFDLLSNVKYNTDISKHVVLKNNILVTDARVEAFLKVSDRAVSSRVDVDIKGNPSRTPRLIELLQALGKKNWDVSLFLHHDFHFPNEGVDDLDRSLCELFRSDLTLQSFKGQLSGSALEELPLSVEDLRLSVKDGDHFQCQLPALTSWEEERNKLQQRMFLSFHVPVDIDESSLWPLPPVDRLHLFVSGVGEATVEKASVVAKALQRSGYRYSTLRFPGIGMTTTQALIQRLSLMGVEAGGVIVSPKMDKGEELIISQLTEVMFHCQFYTLSEDEMWYSGI